MSSDPFVCHTDPQFMPSDLLLPFYDPAAIDSLDILLHDPIDQLSAVADYSFPLLSSPPCHQLDSLSLCQAASSEFPGGFQGHLGYSFSGCLVGTMNVDGSPEGYETFLGPHSYGGHESAITNVVKYVQGSYSSNLFEGKPMAALCPPQFDTMVDSPDFQGQGTMSSPESRFPCDRMRRACSTGDLQRTSLSGPVCTESSFTDEANLQVGRYSAEERKERILKYRAKRTQRNFTKTIKYACRKTLADSRPRIRGRFAARNDETGEPPRAPPPPPSTGDDDLWSGLREEKRRSGGVSGPHLGDSHGQAQFHYSYGYSY